MISLVSLVLAATTCRDVKEMYQANSCCDPSPPDSLPYDLESDVVATLLMTTYRSGPYAFNGIPYADGVAAGIAAHNAEHPSLPVEITECETEYNTVKAIQCYYKHASRADAMITLSTGSVYSLSLVADLSVPLLAAGYGAGAPVNSHVHSSAPTYENAISKFLSMQPSGAKVGFLHMSVAYGNNEKPFFISEAERLGLHPTTYNMGTPAAWGYGVTNLTQVLSTATESDAFFLMPWGGYGTEWLDAALSLGMSPSKFTTLWWGSKEVMHPRFSGVKITNFVNPDHSPVPLDAIALEDRFLYTQGVREAMLFASIVTSLASTTTFVEGDDTYSRDPLVTPYMVNHRVENGFYLSAPSEFMQSCQVGGQCNICTACDQVMMFEYSSSGTITKL